MIIRDTVRVFISSTFRDMKEERDYLMKFVFPEVRQYCLSRGLDFVPIDLRWGITEEQAQRGETIHICLEEIKRCHPYFIGLLGERYGWIPERIPEQPFTLQENQRQISITELEIYHGVLATPELIKRAFFYFRDKKLLDSLPESKRMDFLPESEDIRKKLKLLKDKIRQAKLPVLEDYGSIEILGNAVKLDLFKAIDCDFPAMDGDKSHSAAKHARYASIMNELHIRNEDIDKQLNQSVHDKQEHPLVVCGKPGSGKSTALANWVLDIEAQSTSDRLFYHFVEADSEASQLTNLLERLNSFLAQIGGKPNPEMSSTKEMIKCFQQSVSQLFKAELDAEIIIAIDGLDSFSHSKMGTGIYWLPETFPDNFHIVLSMSEGEIHDSLVRRGWCENELNIGQFSPEDKMMFINDFLVHYSKSLEKAQVEPIVNSQITSNPRCLKNLLEELRLFGEHERLTERICYYLDSRTQEEFYHKMLIRFEEDYDRYRPNLVKDTLCLIALSSEGLWESELLDLLGNDNTLLQISFWSPLFLAISSIVCYKQGLITISNSTIRSAIMNRYELEKRDSTEYFQALASYFENQSNSKYRKLVEYPHALIKQKDWELLYKWMSEQEVFDIMWGSFLKEQCIEYWQILSENGYSIYKAFQGLADACSGTEIIANGDFSTLQNAACLLQDLEDLNSAYKLNELLLLAIKEQRTEVSIDAGFRLFNGVYGNQALIYKYWGKFEQAIALFKVQEILCKTANLTMDLAVVTGNLAHYYSACSRFEDALEYYKKLQSICTEIDDPEGFIISILGQAQVQYANTNNSDAEILAKEGERLGLEYGNLKAVAQACEFLALISADKGDYESSSSYLQRSRIIFEQSNDIRGLISVKNTEYLHLQRSSSDLTAKLSILYEIYNMAVESNYIIEQIHALEAMGREYESAKQYTLALNKTEEALKLVEAGVPIELKDRIAKQKLGIMMMYAAENIKDNDQIIERCTSALEYAKQTDNKESSVHILNYLKSIYHTNDDFMGEIECQLQLAELANDVEKTKQWLTTKMQWLRQSRQICAALDTELELVTITGDTRKSVDILMLQAGLSDRDCFESIAKLASAYELAIELNITLKANQCSRLLPRLSYNCVEQVRALVGTGDLDNARDKCLALLGIAKTFNDSSLRFMVLSISPIIYLAQQNYQEALSDAKEMYALAIEQGLSRSVTHALSLITDIYIRLERYSEAVSSNAELLDVSKKAKDRIGLKASKQYRKALASIR